MTARIFDHLRGEPEDVRFSRVARDMRRGALEIGVPGPIAWWWTVPVRDEPAAVAGEICR